MEINNEISYVRGHRCSDAYTESQTEYVLPDYLGDVRKILYTNAELRPTARFAGGGELECSGIVVYDMIYLDSENNLSSVQFSSDYDYTVKCPSEECVNSVENARLSGFSLRLNGPRRINARASVASSVRLLENECISLSGDGLDKPASLELHKKGIKVRQTALSERVEREYAESLTMLESAIADEVSVIYSCMEPAVEEIERLESALNVKGRLRMLAVVKNGDMGAIPCEKQISFEEMIPFEGAEEDMTFTADTLVTSVKTEVNPEESGCRIVLSGVMEISAVGEKNCLLSPVTDGYLRDYEGDCSYDSFNYTELVDVCSANDSHNAKIPRSEIDAGGLREIIFLASYPKVESIKATDNGVEILGEIKYSGVASDVDADGNISYAMLKFSSPFASNVNINSQNCRNLQYDVKVHTNSTSASIDAENLYATCNLQISVTACEEKCERIMTRINAGGELSGEGANAEITVYYPTAQDTLFSVAKRYKASVKKIASDNSLDASVFVGDDGDSHLGGVKKLIIY